MIDAMKVRAIVTPAARRESLEKVKPNVFAIRVRERAERGEANERVRALLARHFRVRIQSVQMVSGHRGRKKTFEILLRD